MACVANAAGDKVGSVPTANRSLVAHHCFHQRCDQESKNNVGEKRRQHRTPIGFLAAKRKARHGGINAQFAHVVDSTAGARRLAGTVIAGTVTAGTAEDGTTGSTAN
jgi:hypothetical protein